MLLLLAVNVQNRPRVPALALAPVRPLEDNTKNGGNGMKDITCVADLREEHQRRVPKAFFDYVDRGSYAEETLRANRTDLERIKLRQKILVDISKRDLSTTILGDKYNLPIMLAPVGSTGMQYADGEIHACRAAHKLGIPYTLSTMSICSIEDVAENVDKPFWFQLYVMRDRGFVRELIQRAVNAKCSALVLTVDLQVIGQRHADIKNGLSVPPNLLKLKNIIDFATKPGWVMAMLGTKRRNFGNIAGHLKGVDDLQSVAQWTASQFDPALNWKDLDFIRECWPGKLIIKGILDTGDARQAVKAGAQAIVVSNHGGRQLDGAPSSISMVPEIVDAVGHETEVMMDGGIRSGQDVMRALALGAKSCMIGRSYIYGLGAGGEAGVLKALECISNELSVTMGLCGISKIEDIDQRVLMDTYPRNR